MAERTERDLQERAEMDAIVNVWDASGKPIAINGEPIEQDEEN